MSHREALDQLITAMVNYELTYGDPSWGRVVQVVQEEADALEAAAPQGGVDA